MSANLESKASKPYPAGNQAGNPASPTGQLTTHPLLAVLGVLMGALLSVFTGRLLSVGSADIQGAVGAGSDAMTWVSTAYNGANMFIGPFTVFFGGLLGPRRVLLWASVVFMVSEFLCPFVAHNIGALIILQAVAGLASGTFYPLTMTVIVRNLPLKYVQFGVAAYALDILASTHIATALEAWYINHLSWHWIFWNALVVTPPLMACLYFGIPRQPLPKNDHPPSFWGFLYASLGLTLVYCGLDQGERLDWLNSGIIAACFVSGFFLLAAAFISRKIKPLALLDLRFLSTRNFLLLGAVLVLFRFLLLSPVLLLPEFLGAVHGYRPDQTGAVLGWIAVLELIAAPVAGVLLYKVDSRLLCASGFLLAGFACLLNAGLDPGWTGETFVFTQMLTAVGAAFALTGLVTSILRNALFLGALQTPAKILTISCWFQTCRLFGAEVGKAILVRFLKIQGTLHYNILAQHVDGGWLSEERLKGLAGALYPGGSGVESAKLRAAAAMGAMLKRQILLLSISDGFILIAISAGICLLFLCLMTYAPPMVASRGEGRSDK